ncbi:hypothetical protein KAW64_10390 [bacterium]|nr:hypothetical protein [bacterium]
MKTAVFRCAFTVLLVLSAASAQADYWVYFSVDAVHVAELRQGSQFTGPVKLAGRSGPMGDDVRSGLFDNVVLVYILGSHGWIVVDDTFDSLDTSLWGLYGGPSPHLLEDFGNPSPCLMTCGDSLYASGVYSLDPICPHVERWWLQADVYLSSTAEYHTIELGIGSEFAPSGPPGQQTLGHVVGMTWTRNPAGESVLQCVTDTQSIEVPAGDWTGGWHRFTVGGQGFSPVEASSWSRVKALFR